MHFPAKAADVYEIYYLKYLYLCFLFAPDPDLILLTAKSTPHLIVASPSTDSMMNAGVKLYKYRERVSQISRNTKIAKTTPLNTTYSSILRLIIAPNADTAIINIKNS